MTYHSINEFTSHDGENKQFTLSFSGPDPGYLATTDIYLFVNGDQAGTPGGGGDDGFTWISTNIVELKSYTPQPGDTITFRRVTDISNPLVSYSNGSITARVLNIAMLQALYLSQEMQDAMVEGLAAIVLEGNATSIQGVPVSDTPPSEGQVLVLNSGQWSPGTISGGGGSGGPFTSATVTLTSVGTNTYEFYLPATTNNYFIVIDDSGINTGTTSYIRGIAGDASAGQVIVLKRLVGNGTLVLIQSSLQADFPMDLGGNTAMENDTISTFTFICDGSNFLKIAASTNSDSIPPI